MNVYMFRIKDRPYGFRVVAVVGLTEDGARQHCVEQFGAQVMQPYKKHYPELFGTCPAEVGRSVDFEFQE